jgi:hypothetical protein
MIKRIRVRLDWIVEVRGASSREYATEIVSEYLADQDIGSMVEITDAPADDLDLSLVLFPDDEDIPAEPAVPWSTYHRAGSA